MKKTWIDASAAAADNKSGVEGYIERLSVAVQKIAPSEISVFMNFRGGADKRLEATRLPVPPKYYLDTLGVLSTVLAKNIHYPFSIIPKHSAPAIITIYDLAYRRFPEVYDSKTLRILELSVAESINKSAHIITISESTKSDLINFYNVSKDKISVTYLAHDKLYEIKDDAKKTEGGYILAVGNVQPRKNLISLLIAYNQIKDEISQNLILVGNLQSSKEGQVIASYIEENRLESRVKFTGYISDGELKNLYVSADVFIYPSLYEGFGIPILEAMAAGTPVIACNNSSIAEVAGEAAHLCNNTEPNTLADGLMSLLGSIVLRDGLRRKGFEQVKNFSWEKTARETVKIYEALR